MEQPSEMKEIESETMKRELLYLFGMLFFKTTEGPAMRFLGNETTMINYIINYLTTRKVCAPRCHVIKTFYKIRTFRAFNQEFEKWDKEI